MSSQARSKYDNVAIGLHWLTAALVVFMLVFGEELIDATDNGSTFGPSLHISIGSAIFVLTILRLMWRVSHPPPSYPAGMAWWEKLAAKVTHFAFYVLLFVLPISGWLAVPEFLEDEFINGRLMVFGLFPLPAAPIVDLSMDDIHEISSNIAIALVVLHVVAALKHHFISRDDVLLKMLPGGSRRRQRTPPI